MFCGANQKKTLRIRRSTVKRLEFDPVSMCKDVGGDVICARDMHTDCQQLTAGQPAAPSPRQKPWVKLSSSDSLHGATAAGAAVVEAASPGSPVRGAQQGWLEKRSGGSKKWRRRWVKSLNPLKLREL